jgi:hypothetical protein
VLNLAGNHTIFLQWKKTGVDNVVWSVNEQANKLGFTLSAIADYKHLWGRTEAVDKFIATANSWENLTDSLTFELDQTAAVIIGYSVAVQPQLLTRIVRDRRLEYVSTRLLVDGVGIVAGSDTHGTSSWNPRTGILSGYTSVPIRAGVHGLSLQWKKVGSNFKSWASNPSFLDGFAASRNLFVLVTKQSPSTKEAPSINLPARISNAPISSGGVAVSESAGAGLWRPLPSSRQTLNLVKETAALVTYSLPVAQISSPNYTSSAWQSLTLLDTRIVIDGVAYTNQVTSLSSSSRVIQDIKAQLAVVLSAGSHSICVQWRSSDPTAYVDWSTFPFLDDGFDTSVTYLTVLTSHDASPAISVPARYVTTEDVALSISGLNIR